MATAQTLSSLYNEVLMLLGQPGNSQEFAVASGTNAANQQDSKTSIYIHLSRAVQNLGQYAAPRAGGGTLAFTEGIAALPLTAAETTDNSTLIAVQTVLLNGTELRRIGEYGGVYGMNAATGPPQGWNYSGSHGLSLIPTPNTSVSVDLRGFTTPPPLTSDGDTAEWLTPAMTEAVVAYAAARAAESRQSNNNLAGYIPIWQKVYEEEVAKQQKQLVMRNPYLAAFAFGLKAE